MCEEFKFDIFTKGRVADIPVMIQKAHACLYEQQKNFKYKISSECQVISTSTKTMIDLCSRMNKCVESLSNIKEAMIKFSDHTLTLEGSSDDYVDTDIVYDIRWIQNLSFRSYKLIKDKKIVQCFKLLFIEAVQKFDNIQANACDNAELSKELYSHKNVYFKILIPNLYKESVSQLNNTMSGLSDVVRVLIVIIAMEIYTGGNVESARNLYINCRNISIEKLTDISDLLSALHISYMGLELFSLKILYGGKCVELFKQFSASTKIVLSDVKYNATDPTWLDVVSQKLRTTLNKSSDFVHVKSIQQIISSIEMESYEQLPKIIQDIMVDLGLESDGNVQFDCTNSVGVQLKSINDILSAYIPKIITKWLEQSFAYNDNIKSNFSNFSVILDTLNELLDKTNCAGHFRSELARNLNKLDESITTDLSKLNSITFDNINEVARMNCISNLKKLDILASKYMFDKDNYYGKYFDDKLIEFVKRAAETLDKLIKINIDTNINYGKGPRMGVLSELLIRSRFISLYIMDDQQNTSFEENNDQLLVVKSIIAYRTFKPVKIMSIQDAIDSYFMLIKYQEFTSDDSTKDVLCKLGLKELQFDNLNKYSESKQIALEASGNTRYMFPGIAIPHQ
ncbi:hypothetical protein BMR1_01G01755 [Babesia microti strain RI]|uniref:Uncharacterized protein n=1 Tax=Babesia microti (strain RI) TaxID=1133968 RepID=A0A1N6LWS2_BABMR|nr:hypothetical protein BMR1_01G01755 [Babesia microti strain RI]SIO73314.1 hypothetical protein BMR1_01G01755 [Babesia microti strain RI]|eukprot:XP_021337416.1 hypothetical protein BMR1_01G01755 [Babesia microti strain RI]